MVKGILADVNCIGQVQALIGSLRAGPWHEFWISLNLTTPTFADLGMPEETPDRIVWQTCQREQLVLLTGNRNAQGVDSLEETIRALSTLQSLPVITFSDPERFLHDRFYAERTALTLLDILSDMERRRGSGRLFIP